MHGGGTPPAFLFGRLARSFSRHPQDPLSRFTHNNDGFVCENCGFDVPPRAVGCRNHCPRCLASKHVDVFPGDRANTCTGLMDAVDYELDGKKGLVLMFRCRVCKGTLRTMAAHEDPKAPDDYAKILALKSGNILK